MYNIAGFREAVNNGKEEIPMRLRYPCLVLDHDDTVVNSTASVHYPAFLDAMAQLRGGTDLTLEDYFRLNFDPGFMPYMRDEQHFSPADFDREYEIWQGWVRDRVPTVFPGVAEIVRRQMELGGHVCVVSHSVDFNIRRDWKANGLPEPELVFGWEQPNDRRKPNPWPLEEIMRRTGCQPSELLMVDDLKPGWEMARDAGVDFAAAMWAHQVPQIQAFMRTHCGHCFETPADLSAWLFMD